VDIYPVVPNVSKPLLQCTASMLEACGYAGGVVHPSGKYIFMMISQGTTQIDKVKLNQKKIVDTGNYIPYSLANSVQMGRWSMESTIQTPDTYIEIFAFNTTTSAVTTNGYFIGVPSGLDSCFVAERY
jgi:hypothetical protein